MIGGAFDTCTVTGIVIGLAPEAGVITIEPPDVPGGRTASALKFTEATIVPGELPLMIVPGAILVDVEICNQFPVEVAAAVYVVGGPERLMVWAAGAVAPVWYAKATDAGLTEILLMVRFTRTSTWLEPKINRSPP